MLLLNRDSSTLTINRSEVCIRLIRKFREKAASGDLRKSFVCPIYIPLGIIVDFHLPDHVEKMLRQYGHS